MRLSRNQIARFIASGLGFIAFVCFYQPWVSASLPGVGESVFTGQEIARGDAGDRVDAASAPVGGAGAGSAPVTLGGLVLPTRMPTTVPGSSAPPGALVLPTRVTSPSGSTSGAGAAAAGGLVLPTRIATAAPGGQGTGAGAALATAAAATREAFSTAQAAPGARAAAPAVEERAPERLPGLALNAVPLAAAGIAIFAAVWGRLADPKDRLYGKVWTTLLAVGGAVFVGSVVYRVSSATADNDLLAPGAVRAALWGLWGTFLAFVLAATSLAAAWLAPPRSDLPPGNAGA